jgi:hypothetical protein
MLSGIHYANASCQPCGTTPPSALMSEAPIRIHASPRQCCSRRPRLCSRLLIGPICPECRLVAPRGPGDPPTKTDHQHYIRLISRDCFHFAHSSEGGGEFEIKRSWVGDFRDLAHDRARYRHRGRNLQNRFDGHACLVPADALSQCRILGRRMGRHGNWTRRARLVRQKLFRRQVLARFEKVSIQRQTPNRSG